MKNKMLGLIALLQITAATAHAEGTAYFTLPTDFSDNVTATIVGIAGSVLIVLALMFAYRKAVKSVNRS